MKLRIGLTAALLIAVLLVAASSEMGQYGLLVARQEFAEFVEPPPTVESKLEAIQFRLAALSHQIELQKACLQKAEQPLILLKIIAEHSGAEADAKLVCEYAARLEKARGRWDQLQREYDELASSATFLVTQLPVLYSLETSGADVRVERELATSRKELEDLQLHLVIAERLSRAAGEAGTIPVDEPADAAPVAFRQWHDSTGQYSCEAACIAIAGEEVLLKRTDGSQRRVALDRLSAEDREYVAHVQR